VLVNDLLPEAWRSNGNKVLDRRAWPSSSIHATELKGDKNRAVADHLRTFGYTYTTIAFISVSNDDCTFLQ
jgi:hypothetical protein